MPNPEFQRGRRQAFLKRIEGPVLLFAGGHRSRNYPDNIYPFRADSSFLYFFSDPEPESAALFDPADGTVHLFLTKRTPEDALWHGAVASFEDVQARQRVDAVHAVEDLEAMVTKIAAGRSVRSLAIADHHTTARARKITGEDLSFESKSGPGDPALCDVLFDLRIHKHEEELEEHRAAGRTTRTAHVRAMGITRPGRPETELNALVEGTFLAEGCTPAYPNILSVRGEILHNNHHGNIMQDGDLLLLDAGAERASGYCADVTRTWPVNGKFSSLQAEIYDIVLAAELAGIETAAPGVRYRDIHMASSRVIADGLCQMGIMKGNPDDLVALGAHAIFFPHGVGHMVGIDVHDMEGFGDRLHYPNGRKRSTQFGTGFMRMDRDLEVGHVFTVEPGIYFVPAILHEPGMREQFKDVIAYDKAEDFLLMNDGRGFGGIRIEDDVALTPSGREVLTQSVPKTRDEVEVLIGAAAAQPIMAG